MSALSKASLLDELFSNLDQVEDKKSSTHGIHPYPAKFIPQIPRNAILALSEPGDTVLDPMCGSGTTLVEALLNQRKAIGVDINPISTMISTSKTSRLSPEDEKILLVLRSQILGMTGFNTSSFTLPHFPNREHWFSEEVTYALAEIRQAILAVPDGPAKNVALSAFSAIIVGVSMQESETRWARKENKIAYSDVKKRFLKRLDHHIEQSIQFSGKSGGTANVILSDARDLPLRNESVDLVVTSPPYANSHDYYLYHKLRMFWLDHDVYPVQNNEIGSRNKHSDRKQSFSTYMDDMEKVMIECQRVLKSGSHACVVVGDSIIRGEFFDVGVHFADMGSRLGLSLSGKWDFDQRRYTRAFMSSFGGKQPKRTHVLVFTK